VNVILETELPDADTASDTERSSVENESSVTSFWREEWRRRQ
jgi:hypothetical protein